MAAFELWETRSGNLMGSYETRDRALAVIADAIRSYGPAYVITIALMKEDSQGRSHVIAMGSKLADLAEPSQRAGTRPT